jgi:hypothetical protein
MILARSEKASSRRQTVPPDEMPAPVDVPQEVPRTLKLRSSTIDIESFR